MRTEVLFKQIDNKITHLLFLERFSCSPLVRPKNRPNNTVLTRNNNNNTIVFNSI